MLVDDVFEGLGRAVVEVGGGHADAEQGRDVEAQAAEGGDSGLAGAADLERVGRVEGADVFKVGQGFAADVDLDHLRAGVGDRVVDCLASGQRIGVEGRVVAVGDRAFGEFVAAVAGRAVGRENGPPGGEGVAARVRTVGGAQLGLGPEGHEVEGVARAVGQAVVEDRPGLLGEAFAALDVAGVVVEIPDAAAHAAPVEHALVTRRVAPGAVHGHGLARAGGEDPGDAVGQAVRVAGGAGTPGVVRRLVALLQQVEIAHRRAE